MDSYREFLSNLKQQLKHTWETTTGTSGGGTDYRLRQAYRGASDCRN